MGSRGSSVEFGREIRRLRSALGMSSAELAELSGLTESLIRSIESGSCELSMATIRALAQGLGIDPEDLFKRAIGSCPATEELAALFDDESPEVQAALREILSAIAAKNRR